MITKEIEISWRDNSITLRPDGVGDTFCGNMANSIMYIWNRNKIDGLARRFYEFQGYIEPELSRKIGITYIFNK